MEVGASGASGRHAVQIARCGGPGSAPSLHLAPGAKTARDSTSSLSTVPANSAHRVRVLLTHVLKTSLFNGLTCWNKSHLSEGDDVLVHYKTTRFMRSTTLCNGQSAGCFYQYFLPVYCNLHCKVLHHPNIDTQSNRQQATLYAFKLDIKNQCPLSTE